MNNKVPEIQDSEKNALLGMFPSVKSFKDFEKDHSVSDKAIPFVIAHAFEAGVIRENTRGAFLQFLAQNENDDDCTPPENMTFDKILNRITEFSINILLNRYLDKICAQFNISKIQPSMFTRLKKDFNTNTAAKRSTLRIMAYWIGKKHPALGLNYEKLCKLQISMSQIPKPIKEREGVTVVFNIRGNKSLVEPNEVRWIKRELWKTLIEMGFGDIISKNSIETNSKTSFRLKLPKEPGISGEPRLYGSAIRNGLAFAHQMAIRWFLSENINHNNEFEIILYAGEFSDADIILPFLSNASDSEGCSVYLTDFAYQCSKITDMKIILGKTPVQITIVAGTRVNLWILEYFWSHRYFYLIPDLLKEDMLPTTKQSQIRFHHELCFPDQVSDKRFKALNLIRQFPQNSLLILEVARVLLSRRMFWEADMILANILSLNPHNVLARIFRTTVYANLALKESLLTASELSFKRAIAEGEFITGFCSDDSELWRAFGLVYFARGLKYLTALRKDDTENKTRDDIEKDMFSSFEQAEAIFLKGVTSSTAGQDSNAMFLLITTRCLYELLKADKDILYKDKAPVFKDRYNLFRKTALSFFIMVGWINAPSECGKSESEIISAISDSEIRRFINRGINVVANVQDRALSKQYIPGMKYASCSFFWDLTPRLTVGLCRQIRQWLVESRDDMKFFSEHRLSVDVLAPVFPSDPEEFRKCMDKTLNLVNRLIPKKEWKKNNDEFLDENTMNKVDQVKLMLLHFE